METRKHNHQFQNSSMFKSYYVVWKRILDKVFKMCFPCLNRTMQYGNSTLKRIENKKKEGLNRTMQYGNFFSFFHKPSSVVRLNRTMQYGNTGGSSAKKTERGV